MTIKHDQDAAFLLVNIMESILQITREVYDAIEMVNGSWSPRDSFHRSRKNKGFDWDMFTLCTVSIDGAIVEVVSGLLSLTVAPAGAKLTLNGDGSVLIEGSHIFKSAGAEENTIQGPSPFVTKVKRIAKTVNLVPQVSSLVRNATRSIQGYANYKEPTLEDL